MNYRQLGLGIACMILVSNLQYGWTLFVLPLEAEQHWSRAAIQFAYSLFIAAQSWSFPFFGAYVDRAGARRSAMIGGALIALGWCFNAWTNALGGLYAGELAAGLGSGLVLTAVYGSALKTDSHRGLVVGLTSAGYGIGSALTVAPLAWMIESQGYRSAFVIFGLLQGILVIACASGFSARTRMRADTRTFTPAKALAQPAFWIMYAMFVLVATGGLMATAQLAPLAHDYGVAGSRVSLLGVSATALVFALSLDRIANGFSRPFFGWVSDSIGREATMLCAFALEGLAVIGLVHFADDPVLFVVLTGLTFFAWGEIFSLFPSLCTDLFGKAYGATNYGILYTAKGVAGFFVPWASAIAAGHAWGWTGVLYLVAAFDFTAAILAVAVIVPLRRRMHARS